MNERRIDEDSMRVTLNMDEDQNDPVKRNPQSFGNSHDIVGERLKNMNPL
jgi:hypothetical protein